MGLTPEQQLAVDKSNTNIIVSAGAGSGKTTVLKERVLRELKQGVNVNDLIILTFTNNAAQEMKERIRKIISNNPEVSEQALYLDSAYITTFDSFAQSLVKKYNYLLNMSKDFSIVDASIVNLELESLLNQILEEKYASPTQEFAKFIEDFSIKNDKELRKHFLNMYKSTANIIDRKAFFDTYVETYYSDAHIDSLITEYEELVFRFHNDICVLLEQLNDETLKEEKMNENYVATANFVYASSLDELIDYINFSLVANRGNVYSEEGALIKDKIGSLKKTLQSYLILPKADLIKYYKSTKDSALVIIDILRELDKRITAFKVKNNAFEFNDIALKAIELVREHESVREEIKNKTFEIMIDEYQDTNDVQETFISYIENNNVYMVGDIKQSIYRFRNANPYIFKNKYDKYREGINGFKIDLNKNFRSRSEVINNINLIFNNIMSDDIGGANYKEEHQMVFGNTTYDKVKTDTNYDMELLTYDNDSQFSDDEIEAFIIAKDIKDKMSQNNKTVTIENDQMVLKDMDYSDFVILVDKGKNFDLLKKVLEFNGIPATIDKDISIKDEDEIYILKNLIKLVISIRDKKFDVDFKHSYISIARSYIFRMSDKDIFNAFISNTFSDTELYKKCLSIADKVNDLSIKEILMELITEFDIINKLSTVGGVTERLTKLEYFINNSNNLNNFGYSVDDLVNYFDEVLKGSEDIKMSQKAESGNSVKIMTIHKSKGLEYNYVYLPYLGSDFTKMNNKTDFKYSNKYGFVIPFYDNGVGKTLLSALHKNNELTEELSEKIRLFYVALTRPKEKFIMINKNNEKIEGSNNISYSELINVKSLGDIMSLLKYKLSPYTRKINLEDINLSKDYNIVKEYNYKKHIKESNKVISVKRNTKVYEYLENKHFSKALNKVIDKKFRDTLDFGTYMHYLFEVLDFKNNNIDELDIIDEYKDKLRNFLKHEEVKNISTAKVYKEHEIRFVSDGSIYHGFIDLMVEYDDYIDIIDYKLSNISSEEYVTQLNGYKNYIENKYNKPTNIYLYSINKDLFKKLN